MLKEELHGKKNTYSMFKAMGSIPSKNIFTEAQEDVKDLDLQMGYPEENC